MLAGKPSEADELLSQTCLKAKQLGYKPLEAECQLLHGDVLADVGKHQQAAEVLFGAALASREGQTKEVEVQAYLALVRVVGRLQWHTERAHVYLEYATALASQLGSSARLQGQLEGSRAELLYYSQGRPADAQEPARNAHQLLLNALGPQHPRLLWSASLLGWILMDLGQLPESTKLLAHVHHVRTQLFGPDHPEVGKSLFNLASVQLANGDLSKATVSVERAIELWTKTLGPNHPLTLRAMALRAECALESSRGLEGRDRLLRVIPPMEQAYGSSNPRVALARVLLGQAWLQLGEPLKAEEQFEHALHSMESQNGALHPWLSEPLIGLAETSLMKGDVDTALAYAERSASVYGDSGNRFQIARTRFVQARILQELGTPQQQTDQLAKLALEDLEASRPQGFHIAQLRHWMASRSKKL